MVERKEIIDRGEGYILVKTTQGIKKILTELSDERVKRLLESFKFPRRYIEEAMVLNLTEKQKRVAGIIRKWIFKENNRELSLYLYGKGGIGKTFLLTRLTYLLLKKLEISQTLYLSFATLMNKNIQTIDKVLKFLEKKNFRYFIIDDVYIPNNLLEDYEIKKISNFFYGLYNIIHSRKRVILIGNTEIEKIWELPSHPIYERMKELLLTKPIKLEERNFRLERIKMGF